MINPFDPDDDVNMPSGKNWHERAVMRLLAEGLCDGNEL